MKIVYSCANKYIRWTMGTYFFIRPQGYNLWDFCLVCGCNSSVQSSAWHRVSKIDIYWQKEWIHFGNSSVPPYSKPVTVCKMNACGHCTLEVWSSQPAASGVTPGFKFQPELSSCVTLREFHGFWSSVCPHVPWEWSSSISFWQDCERWNRLRSNLCSPWCLSMKTTGLVWSFSPHFITFSSSAWTHIFKTMWKYQGRWKVQRIWCQNTAKHLRLSTWQTSPWQQQRTRETCIPVSVGLLQLAPHLRLILCFPSTCPAVRPRAASCSPFWEAQWHRWSRTCAGLTFTQKCIIECLERFN